MNSMLDAKSVPWSILNKTWYNKAMNDISNGAQFLVIKDASFKKVTAFPEFPIEMQTLTANDLSENDFVKAGRVGFILTNVDSESATIKFLNTNVDDMKISLGEKKEFSIDNNTYTVELWAVRYNAPAWDQWKVSF